MHFVFARDDLNCDKAFFYRIQIKTVLKTVIKQQIKA